MDDLLEIVFEMVGEIFSSIFEKKKNKLGNDDSGFKLMHLNGLQENESYIVGFIITAIAYFYHGDNKLDKSERKIINKFINNLKDEISKKTRKKIKKVIKRQISFDNLTYFFDSLNIDKYSVMKITNDIERLLREKNKNSVEGHKFIDKLRKIYNPEYY